MLIISKSRSASVVPGSSEFITASKFAEELQDIGINPLKLRIRQQGRPPIQFGPQLPQSKLPTTCLVSPKSACFVSEVQKK